LWLREVSAEFVLTDVAQLPKISWLRHFSAPVILQLTPTLEDYIWQAMHDDDLFNRWEACQQAWVLILKNGVLALRDGQGYQPASAMQALYQQLLGDETLPKAWLVEAVKLPSFDYLAQQLDTLWVEEWLTVIRTTKAWLGDVLRADWWRVIERSALESEYRFNAQAMADRALHQQALAYLAEGKDEHAWTIAYEQVQAGDNMTLVQSALTLLVHTNAPQAESALALFYERWQDVPLVVDKWFSIQAGSPQGNAQAVDALSTHPAFVWTNPNRVRSVYGVMGRANAKVFHQADGQGYALVAKRIVEIDSINPQLSARLLQAFSSWRKYPESYQQMAKAELEAISKVDTLSKDAREVLGHLLE
jgi:aminopeptidase N